MKTTLLVIVSMFYVGILNAQINPAIQKRTADTTKAYAKNNRPKVDPKIVPPFELLTDSTAIPGTFIAAGEKGALIYSINESRAWRRSIFTRQSLSFNALDVNPKTGVVMAVGEGSMLVKSANQGRSFVRLDGSIFGKYEPLQSIRCHANGRWIIIDTSHLWMSDNDGKNWSNIVKPEFLNCIEGGSDSTWYGAGPHGLFYTSSDNGNSWTKTTIDGIGDIQKVFYSETQILVLSDSTVKRSLDNGITWSKVQQGNGTWFAVASAYDGKTRVNAGKNGEIQNFIRYNPVTGELEGSIVKSPVDADLKEVIFVPKQ